MNTNEKLEFVKNGLKNLHFSLNKECKNLTFNKIDEFIKLYLDIIEN